VQLAWETALDYLARPRRGGGAVDPRRRARLSTSVGTSSSDEGATERVPLGASTAVISPLDEDAGTPSPPAALNVRQHFGQRHSMTSLPRVSRRFVSRHP
jgi:hypothetical protein